MITPLACFALLIAIILINIFYEKKHIGIILLHNNDHTLNKILDYLMNFFEKQHLIYHIIVIKEKRPNKERSTGFLFNIGYRQLGRMNHYLMIDTRHCSIQEFYKALNSQKIIPNEQLLSENKIHYIPSLCGIAISRNMFKRIDGFSNQPNQNFIEFLDNLHANQRKKYGGYQQMNHDITYHIYEKIMLSPSIIRLIIA